MADYSGEEYDGVADLQQVFPNHLGSMESSQQLLQTKTIEEEADRPMERNKAMDLYNQTLFDLIAMVQQHLSKMFKEGVQTNDRASQTRIKSEKAEKGHANFCRMFTKQYLKMKRLDEYKKKEPKFHTAFTDLITYVYSNLQNLLKNKTSPRDYSNDTKMEGKKIIGSSNASLIVKPLPETVGLQPGDPSIESIRSSLNKASRGGKFDAKQIDLKNVRQLSETYGYAVLSNSIEEDEVEYDSMEEDVPDYRRGSYHPSGTGAVTELSSEMTPANNKMKVNFKPQNLTTSNNARRSNGGLHQPRPDSAEPTLPVVINATPELIHMTNASTNSKYYALRQLADESASVTTMNQSMNNYQQTMRSINKLQPSSYEKGTTLQRSSVLVADTQSLQVKHPMAKKNQGEKLTPLVYNPQGPQNTTNLNEPQMAQVKVKPKARLDNKLNKSQNYAPSLPSKASQAYAPRQPKIAASGSRGEINSREEPTQHKVVGKQPKMDKLKANFTRKNHNYDGLSNQKHKETKAESQGPVSRYQAGMSDYNQPSGSGTEMHLTESGLQSEVPESTPHNPNTIINNNSFIITINKGSATNKNQLLDKKGKRIPSMPQAAIQPTNKRAESLPPVGFQDDDQDNNLPKQILDKKAQFQQSKQRFFQDQKIHDHGMNRVKNAHHTGRSSTGSDQLEIDYKNQLSLHSSVEYSQERESVAPKVIHEIATGKKHHNQQSQHFYNMQDKYSQKQMSDVQSKQDGHFLGQSFNTKHNHPIVAHHPNKQQFLKTQQNFGAAKPPIPPSSFNNGFKVVTDGEQDMRVSSGLGNLKHATEVKGSYGEYEMSARRVETQEQMVRSDIHWMIQNQKDGLTSQANVLSDSDESPNLRRSYHRPVQLNINNQDSEPRVVHFQDHVDDLWRANQPK